MEYEIGAFTERLIELFLDSNAFPYMREPYLGQSDESKHSKRNPTHLRDAIRQDLTIEWGDDSRSFNIGSESLELSHPHYHILETAPVIRKRYKGTTKSKGTQDMIKDKAKRDYEYVYWNGKTFTKEYSKNVRGSRNRITHVSHWTEDYAGNKVFVDRTADAYQNIHYRYIEEILNSGILDTLAREFGLSRRRTQDTGLVEEFAYQEGVSVESVLEAFESFM